MKNLLSFIIIFDMRCNQSYVSKIQGIQKFYDIEDDKNPLTKKITQKKQSVVKDVNKSNRIKISIN